MPTLDISTFPPGLPGGRVSVDLPQVTTVMPVMAPGGARNPQQEAVQVELGAGNETKRFQHFHSILPSVQVGLQ